MKILYNTVGSAGGYTTLVDPSVSGNTIEEWSPNYSAKPQVEELAQNFGQGGTVFTNTLGNLKNTQSLKIAVTYLAGGGSSGAGDLGAALAASRSIPLLFLTTLINLQIVEPSGSGETQYLPNCVFSKCKPTVQGATVVFDMDFVSQMVTSTPPS